MSDKVEHQLTAPEYIAYLETDCGKFRLLVDVRLFAPIDNTDDEETEFRARQVLDLFRACLEDETRRINFLTSMFRGPRQFGFLPPFTAVAAGNHAHCECRTGGCGHIDLRHVGGPCNFEGCECPGWS